MPDWDQFEAVAEPPTDWSEFEPVIKPTPYQEADIASMTAGRGKAPTGMEAGTEFTAATGGIPALAIPSAMANAAINKALLAGANIPSAISRFTAPLVGGEEIEPISEVPEVKLPRVPGRGALSGLANVGIGGVEPFIQPASLLMLPIIGTGGGAGKLAATLFGAQQAAAIPPQIQQAIQVLDDPNSTRAQKIEAVGLPAISTALSALMLKHGARGPAEELASVIDKAKLEPVPGTAGFEEGQAVISPETRTIERPPGMVTAETLLAKPEDFEVVAEPPKAEPAPPVPEAKAEPAAPTPWVKIYSEEHKVLLDAQRALEESDEPSKIKAARQERDDALQRLDEFDKLSKDESLRQLDPTVEALRDNPRLTLSEAVSEGQRITQQRKGDAAYDSVLDRGGSKKEAKRAAQKAEAIPTTTPAPPEAKAPTPSDVPAEQRRIHLKQLGLTDADISDLESGHVSVPGVVARKLPGEPGRGPDHAKALEEARAQAVQQIESILSRYESISGRRKAEVKQVPEKPATGSGKVVQALQGTEPTAGGRRVGRGGIAKGLPPEQPGLDPISIIVREPNPAKAADAIERAGGVALSRREQSIPVAIDTPEGLWAATISPSPKGASIASGYGLVKDPKSYLQWWVENRGAKLPDAIAKKYVLSPVAKAAAEVQKLARTEGQRSAKDLASLTAKLESGQPLTKSEKARYLKLRKEATGETAQPKPEVQTGLPPGPGAMTPGEPEYPAISQLTDRLKATPAVGLKDSISLKERVAEQWAKGKSQMSRAVGKMRAVTEALKETGRGVRTPTDLDRKVGQFDWAIQSSAGRSKQARQQILRQMPSEDMRGGVALWIDAGGDETLLKEALDNLPAGTSPSIRRALNAATKLSPEAKQFAQDLRQFFSVREQDAMQHELFEQGLKDYYTHIWEKEANMPDELRAAFVNGRLSTYFKFARQRKIPMFLDGIMTGKKPVLDPAKVIPFYNYAMDRAIASREFIKQASEVVMPDGRPLLSPSGLRSVIEKGDTPEALIIRPKARSEQNADYHQVDHPALRKWKWAGTGEHGEPILYQGDLLVHPEGFTRLANMMDRGRLTPTKWGGRLLRASTEVKGFKLGLLSAFHNVHVASHAAFHWTNPFKALGTPIDWDAPGTKFAVEQGHLKIAPDPSELRIAAEGIMSGGLVHKIPLIGPLSKAWSEWTFGEMIPQLKLRTFENAYKRNLWAREHLPGSGLKGLTDEEIAARVGDSVNNAFGELNHMFLGKNGRNPQFQRLLRGIFLAPDFGEARLRFVEKAFTKTGFEERLALASMFTTLYLGARVANWLDHGDPETDWKRAFQVKSGDHWWSMRSVVGDVDHAMADFGRFMYVRLNPLYSRTAADFLYGRDAAGRKLSASQKLGNVFKQLVPIQMGGLTRPDQQLWESFVSAMGLSAQRDRPEQDLGRALTQWMSKSDDPKIQQKYQQREGQVFAESVYAPLRFALEAEDYGKAHEEYDKLKEIRKPMQIRQQMAKEIKTMGGLTDAEFRQFLKDMTPEQRKLFEQAKENRKELYRRYQLMVTNKE